MIHCPGCAAGLRFDIPTQSMRCDACGGSYDPNIFDDKREEAKTAQMFNAYVFVCPSCGAELSTTDETDAVGFCPYCGGASLIYDRVRTGWKPDAVIPFKITKEQCKEAYIKAAKKSFFTSKKYRDPALIDSFRGIYMPYWDYMATQKGKYTLLMQGSQHRSGDYLERAVYRLEGQIDLNYDGYTHDAAESFDDRISEDLAPYDINEHRPFVPGYLSGFYADIGNVPKEQYYDKTKACLIAQSANVLQRTDAVEQALRGTPVLPDGKSPPGYSSAVNRVTDPLSYVPASADIPTEVSDARRVLYPVWFMSYRRGNEITYATVNGQTGKVSADFPVSPVKVLLTALGTATVIFLLLAILPAISARWALLLAAALLVAGSLVIKSEFKKTLSANPDYFYGSSPAPDSKGKVLKEPATEKELKKEKRKSRLKGLLYLLLGLIAALFLPFLFEETSKRSQGASALLMFGVIVLIFVLCYIYAKRKEAKEKEALSVKTDYSNAQIKDAEAKRYAAGKTMRIVLIVLTCLFAFVIFILDPAYNYLPYFGCFICAAELFFFMLQHMRFQADIAHRRPPQFNKRGGNNDAS